MNVVVVVNRVHIKQVVCCWLVLNNGPRARCCNMFLIYRFLSSVSAL
jgi:hypothetical protein